MGHQQLRLDKQAASPNADLYQFKIPLRRIHFQNNRQELS